MQPRIRRRLRIETALAAVAAALAILTVVFPSWIEAFTGVDPDAGSGAAESMLAGSLLLLALAAGVLARRDRRLLVALGGTA